MGEAKRNLEDKKKAFEENPDRFVDIEDILIAAMRREDGAIAVMNNITKVQDIIDCTFWVEDAMKVRCMQIRLNNEKTQLIKKPTLVNGQGQKIV